MRISVRTDIAAPMGQVYAKAEAERRFAADRAGQASQARE
jgi:hypothetical protein